jgi:hypothetical protein
MDNELLQLAFAIRYAPKVYALLLGSGVSRAAGIPTGWDVIGKLIEEVAIVQQGHISEDPIVWYEKHYGKQPTYTDLLEQVGVTSFIRNAILRQYFEPTDEEREYGLKVPTQAHRAIASLVKQGYIRVIVTTNFDQLLETALRDLGVNPHIISSPESLASATPIEHSAITIIKVHGDYTDWRSLNTAEELSQYSDAMNGLLDQIFRNYGIIICGWSADWDTALRDALLRSGEGRYSTFWASYGSPTTHAQTLITHRQARVINIFGADAFFKELAETVEALEAGSREHPLTIAAVVERAKKYVSNELHRIDLEELLRTETERSFQRFRSGDFIQKRRALMGEHPGTLEDHLKAWDLYFEAIEPVLHIMAVLCLYDRQSRYWHVTEALNRWLEVLPEEPSSIWRWVPGLYLLYTAGIAALRARHLDYIPALLKTKVKQYETRTYTTIGVATSERLIFWYISNFSEPRPIPINQYLQERLRSIFQPYIPSDLEYTNVFDLFEVLLALAYIDTPERENSDSWMPPHISIYHSRSWEYINEFWSAEASNLALQNTKLWGNKYKTYKDLLRGYENILVLFRTSTRSLSLDYKPNYSDKFDDNVRFT